MVLKWKWKENLFMDRVWSVCHCYDCALYIRVHRVSRRMECTTVLKWIMYPPNSEFMAIAPLLKMKLATPLLFVYFYHIFVHYYVPNFEHNIIILFIIRTTKHRFTVWSDYIAYYRLTKFVVQKKFLSAFLIHKVINIVFPLAVRPQA